MSREQAPTDGFFDNWTIAAVEVEAANEQSLTCFTLPTPRTEELATHFVNSMQNWYRLLCLLALSIAPSALCILCLHGASCVSCAYPVLVVRPR